MSVQATTLGIPATRYSPYSRGAPRGTRGTRARGRGGRGSTIASRPMRLDNRSRSVLLTGDFLSSDTSKQSAQAWFESTGGAIGSGNTSEGMVVSYPTREMAEKALALGTARIELNGKNINAGWYSGGVGSKEGLGVDNGHRDDHGGEGEVDMADEDERRRGEDMDDD